MTTEINMILGLAVMFGLSIVMTFITIQDIETFFVWLNIFSGFVVWASLLPLWVVVINIILITLIIINKAKKRSVM